MVSKQTPKKREWRWSLRKPQSDPIVARTLQGTYFLRVVQYRQHPWFLVPRRQNGHTHELFLHSECPGQHCRKESFDLLKNTHIRRRVTLFMEVINRKTAEIFPYLSSSHVNWRTYPPAANFDFPSCCQACIHIKMYPSRKEATYACVTFNR